MTTSTTTPTTNTTTISTTKYSGHKGPVLCLDVSGSSSSSSLLLSGSEDKTARIWDVRDGGGGGNGSTAAAAASTTNRRRPRASLCIPTKGEVLSAVFATAKNSQSKSFSSSSSSSSSAYDHTIYLGVNNTVLEYDLRRHTQPVNITTTTTTTNNDNTNANATTNANRREFKSPIWMDPPTNNLYQVLQNEEEVNQISTTLWRCCQNTSSSNNSSSIKKKGSGRNKKNHKQSKKNENKSKYDAEACYDDDNTELVEEFFIAACDDSGTVRVTSSSTTTASAQQQENSEEKPDDELQNYNTTHHQTHILKHDPEGIAVVSSCTFRPLTTTAQLISGGMDCKVHLWDLSSSSSSSLQLQQQQQQQQRRIRKPLCSVSMQQQQQHASSAQAVNPPMVHSLSWSPSGQYFAAGLGNGDVNLYTVPFPVTASAGNRRNNEIVQIGQLSEGHSSSVVSVLYPEVGLPTDTDQVSNVSDRILCSAGSDGKIMFWDLSSCTRGDSADDLDAILAELDVSSNNGSIDDKQNGGEDEISKLFAESLLMDGRSKNADARRPSVIFEIDHKEKINWVTKATSSSTTAGRIINDTIFVADTSNDITSYKIPLA